MSIKIDFIRREEVPHEINDDGGLLYAVERAGNGIITAKVRVYGNVTIDGRDYGYDEDFRVRLKPKD